MSEILIGLAHSLLSRVAVLVLASLALVLDPLARTAIHQGISRGVEASCGHTSMSAWLRWQRTERVSLIPQETAC